MHTRPCSIRAADVLKHAVAWEARLCDRAWLVHGETNTLDAGAKTTPDRTSDEEHATANTEQKADNDGTSSRP